MFPFMTELDGRGKAPPGAAPSTRRRAGRTPLAPPVGPMTPAPAPLRSPDDTVRQPPPAAAGSVLLQHPSAAPIHIRHETVVAGEAAEMLWEAYRSNFEPLSKLAMLRHFYSREIVLAEFANPNIVKIVGWQAGKPAGLAMVTNSLDDVPQISPEFLRASYPQHAAKNTIYFGILVMVAPNLRGLTLFSRLYLELWQIPARAGGVLVYDICDFNRLSFDTDKLSQRIAANFPDSSVSVLDRQTWYVADLPKPIPDPPSA